MEVTEAAVREFTPRGAFVDELRNRLAQHRLDVRALAEQVGIARTRLHQILAQATPPPGPEVVDRLADVLGLDPEDRRWMQWLALRDRCDLPARSLIEIYELALMKAWGSSDARTIPATLGDQLELTNFIVANRPVYLRHSKRPVFVRVHDEDGELRQSLVDGLIVRVEPADMHSGEFLDHAKDHLVLVNERHRCRIGWLKARKDGTFHLHGDNGQPLATEHAAAGSVRAAAYQNLTRKNTKPAMLVIGPTTERRPYVGDIQAIIPSSTLQEIAHRRRQELARRVHSIRGAERTAQAD